MAPCLDSGPMDHVDVLILGAGLSGIGAACHLETRRPGTSYAILEARDVMGGTWDLFRYPGVRSDSDMFTLGYSFEPWVEAEAIADGPSILAYIRSTARSHGGRGQDPLPASGVPRRWSTADARWTVEVEHTDTGERSGHLLVPVGRHGLLPLRRGLPPDLTARTGSAGRSSTPSTGPRTSTSPAGVSSSSAAARPP